MSQPHVTVPLEKLSREFPTRPLATEKHQQPHARQFCLLFLGTSACLGYIAYPCYRSLGYRLLIDILLHFILAQGRVWRRPDEARNTTFSSSMLGFENLTLQL